MTDASLAPMVCELPMWNSDFTEKTTVKVNIMNITRIDSIGPTRTKIYGVWGTIPNPFYCALGLKDLSAAIASVRPYPT